MQVLSRFLLQDLLTAKQTEGKEGMKRQLLPLNSKTSAALILFNRISCRSQRKTRSMTNKRETIKRKGIIDSKQITFFLLESTFSLNNNLIFDAGIDVNQEDSERKGFDRVSCDQRFLFQELHYICIVSLCC